MNRVPFEAETWGTPIDHEPERDPVVPPDWEAPRPLVPQECGHKLCHEEATEAIEVFNPWAKCVFNVGQRLSEDRRHYALCDAHFKRYFPRGLGYVGRREAVALRIQCRETTLAPERAP